MDGEWRLEGRMGGDGWDGMGWAVFGPLGCLRCVGTETEDTWMEYLYSVDGVLVRSSRVYSGRWS
jgi:hypothetical protein